MIRLMCPHCQSIVSVPDSAAGRDADCPSCGKAFPAPARYTPVVAVEKALEPPAPEPVAPPPADRPPPPPGLVPVAPMGEMPAMPTGYSHRRGLTISPQFMAWVPAVGFALIVLLAFIPWVGLFPAGYPAYTQSGAGAAFGRFSAADHVLEDILKLKASLDAKVRSDWELMVPYLLGLLFATFVAVAERLYHNRPAAPVPRSVAWLGPLWTHRLTLLTALAAGLLCFVFIQMLAGFSLERGVKSIVAQEFAERREKAANSTAELNRLDILQDMEYARYRVQRTTWLYLTLLLHVVVIVALLARLGLARRGNKLPPRLVAEY